jgi:hypothetical protein
LQKGNYIPVGTGGKKVLPWRYCIAVKPHSSMDSRDFFNPHLSGKRFDDHTIPLELLEDFTTYEELLLAAAKWVYYQQYGRQRVPKGFGDGVSLKLSGVKDGGSSIATIVLAAATTFHVGDLDTYPIFEQARERIVKTIDAAERNIVIEEGLPPHFLVYFAKIGKRLRDDEVIDFAPNSQYNGKLTKANRKKLALAAPNVQLVEGEFSLRGRISMLDILDSKCHIYTSSGLEVSVPFDREYFSILTEVLSKFDDKCKVLISGIGNYDKQDKLQSIIKVDSVTVLSSLDVASRLEEFLTLEAGWMDGDGNAFNKSDLDWLTERFESNFNSDTLIPFAFPTADGGIQFEWKSGPKDMTVDVTLNDKKAYLHYLDSSINEDFERELDLNSQNGWDDLIGLVLTNFKKPNNES